KVRVTVVLPTPPLSAPTRITVGLAVKLSAVFSMPHPLFILIVLPLCAGLRDRREKTSFCRIVAEAERNRVESRDAGSIRDFCKWHGPISSSFSSTVLCESH